MKNVCMYDREDEYENNCGLSYMLGGHERRESVFEVKEKGWQIEKYNKCRWSFKVIFDRYPTCLGDTRSPTVLSKTLSRWERSIARCAWVPEQAGRAMSIPGA